jgi:hypothetical protein
MKQSKFHFCSDKAIKATNDSGLQAALDWLEANADNEAAFQSDAVEESKAAQKTCLKCNQCGKKFSEIEQAELHAARTKHDDFQEALFEVGELFEVSSEPVIPLNEEEKAQKLAQLREKVALKRAAREKEVYATELKRRTDAKELEQIRRELELKEMKKLAEERRQDKIKERQLREEIKRQIEEDRKSKKANEEAERALRNAASAATENVVISAPSVVPTIAADHARIQVRMPPPAQPLKFAFDSPKTETLADLKAKISESIGGKSVGDLLQTFPTRTLSAADDKKTLFELGLCPSASLSMK